MALIRKTHTPSDGDSRRLLRDREGLLRQLDDESAEARRWAALDLAVFPEAAEALCAHLQREIQPAVRQAMLTALIEIGSDAVVEGLLPLLRSEDAAVRNPVVEAFQHLPDAVSPHIETMLQDSDPDYRIFTVNVLNNLRHPQTPGWLQTVIESDADINVCAAAVEVLAEVGALAAIPALTALPGRFADDPFMQFCVQAAIRRIQGK
ncbi:MAG: HEAT repeat domain-containing protein [Candidatus Contendobacter sp.]|nr:HEAT repeat domain-containing protein [Candidatus Contendobacter sp.]